MQQAIEQHLHTFGVLFAVGLGSVTRRFGAERGEEALAMVTKQIAANLGEADLAVSMERAGTAGASGKAARRTGRAARTAADGGPSSRVHRGGGTARAVKIPLKISSISFHLWEYETLDAVRRILDQCQQTIAPDAV